MAGVKASFETSHQDMIVSSSPGFIRFGVGWERALPAFSFSVSGADAGADTRFSSSGFHAA
jgi:hypothetical protein